MAHSALGGTGVALAVGEGVDVGSGKVGLGEGAWQPERSRVATKKMENSVRTIFGILFSLQLIDVFCVEINL